jgi:glucose-6-phosphate-specific signal transduction histidine kinase
MAIEELPLANNITTVKSFYDYISIVEPNFWPVILGAWWVIMFSISAKFGASRGFLIAGFVAFIPALIISVIGWMDIKWMYLFLILTATGIFWRWIENDQ